MEIVSSNNFLFYTRKKKPENVKTPKPENAKKLMQKPENPC